MLPEMPSLSASRLAHIRYPTPWTCPLTSIRSWWTAWVSSSGFVGILVVTIATGELDARGSEERAQTSLVFDEASQLLRYCRAYATDDRAFDLGTRAVQSGVANVFIIVAAADREGEAEREGDSDRRERIMPGSCKRSVVR